MISITDLVVDFGAGPVLDGITLEAPEGSMTVVLGKNGSGKSVLLKTVMGLVRATAGAVRVAGADPAGLLERPREGVEMGYVFQKGGLFDSLSVFENIAFPLRRRGMEEDDIGAAVVSILDRVGLAGSGEKYPSELSGGMQKRVGLARAVCANPNVVLYDDPTAGLDPILSDSIAGLILDIRMNFRATSLVATHDLKTVEKIADQVLLLYGGKIVFQGTKEEFFEGSSPFAQQFCSGDPEGPIDIF